ncbi:MAG: GNAT family N-acetyltransferase [Gammaproteobacteria bacterium]
MIEVRVIEPEELPAMVQAMGQGFGFDLDPRGGEGWSQTLERDRTRCAFDGAEIIGTSGAHSFQLAVPGATLPAGGTTVVTVRATHRRCGVLRSMMQAHFEDVRERAEPLAVLWASEAGIYGRFGYGCASELAAIEVERAHGSFARPVVPGGDLRLLDGDTARTELPTLYESLWRARPGSFARSDRWWDARHFSDPASMRGGASALRRVLYERGGVARGFLQYRTRMRNDGHGLPRGELQIVDLHGADAEARAALWNYSLSVDLIDRVTWWNAPIDDPLAWLLADPRRVMRRLRDGLWLRVIDLPRALAARRYACAGRLVLRVQDTLFADNDGTWLLDGCPDGATCTRTSARSDVELDAEALGAIYLGGIRPSVLAHAGRIHGAAAVLARADAMFGWSPLPWCPEIF